MPFRHRIHIVISDRGWILETCAREIATRLGSVTYDLESDPSADLQYYITYSKFVERRCPIEVGFFTHLEQDPATQARFFDAAAHMDHCVTMAGLYEAKLREAGIDRVTTISPGVDLAQFQPRLRIGVIGRTYSSGRKGEALLAEVMDIPEIDWRFTGEGWPGPVQFIAPERMPEFYNSLDYVLVPSLYEGGPMCVLEALACGRQVIAPDVGFVPDFSHIPFRTGDASDLRRVLLGLIEDRRQLRREVEARGWSDWAAGHQRLFEALFAQHADRLAGSTSVVMNLAPDEQLPRVVLGLHGPEVRAHAQGGPSVRVPRAVRELRQIGFEASLVKSVWPAPDRFDVGHVFNVSTFDTALAMLDGASQLQKPVVFSPILLDQCEREIYTRSVPDVFKAVAPEGIDAALAQLRAAHPIKETRARFYGENRHRQASMIREMIARADHVVLLSEHERDLLKLLGAEPRQASLVHNPVDAGRFAGADPDLFRDRFGLKDYVLCVARIEPRKNQLMLAHALRGLELPLVLVGHVEEADYLELVRQHGGANIHVIDRLAPGSALLTSAYRGARVCVLPSWAEGAPLSALEAAAAGARLVLSDRSGELEYFGERAHYCDPFDPASIRSAVLAAWNDPHDEDSRSAQMEWVRTQYGWDRYTGELAELYRDVYRRDHVAKAERRKGYRPRIYFDLSTNAHTDGHPVGTSRVEANVAQGLAARLEKQVRFTVWNPHFGLMLDIAAANPTPEHLRSFGRTDAIAISAEPIAPAAGDILLITGNAWIGRADYVQTVLRTCREHGLALWLLVHDLIPLKFPHLQSVESAATFEENLYALLNQAEQVLTYSESTRSDLAAYCKQHNVRLRVERIHLGADAVGSAADPTTEAPECACDGRPYVLYVSTIGPRKNHALLFEVWRQLAREMGDQLPRLICVGRVARECASMVEAVEHDPLLSGHVSVLCQISDAELDGLYRNCAFTVFPSLYEGWGIPVAESLAHGKPCLAARAGSVPEISPLLTLLDPEDLVAWKSSVLAWLRDPAAVERTAQRIREQYRPATWEATAQELATLLGEPPAPRVMEARRRDRRVFDFSQAAAAAECLRGGWSYLENWGCWSQSTEARILLPCVAQVKGPVCLTFRHRVHVRREQPELRVRVRVNGHACASWQFAYPQLPRDRHATLIIPEAVHQGRGTLDIRLTIEGVRSPQELGLSDDRRLLGIGIEQIVMWPLSDGEQKLLATHARTEIDLGEAYSFRADGKGLACLAFGWGRVEKWGTWSVAPRAQLVLRPRAHLRNRLLLRFRLRAFVRAEFPRLEVSVYANGIKVDRWIFQESVHRGEHERELVIPTRAFDRSKELRLVFHCENVSSPSALGLNQDQRKLGIGLVQMQAWELGEQCLAPASAAVSCQVMDSNYQLGDEINLAEVVDPSCFLLDGWSKWPAETNGSTQATGWAMTRHGRLLLSCGAPSACPGHFTIGFTPFFGPEDAQLKIHLLVNGSDIGQQLVSRDEHGSECVRDWQIPARLLHLARKHELELRLEAVAFDSTCLASNGNSHEQLDPAPGVHDSLHERALVLQRFGLRSENYQLGETIVIAEDKSPDAYLIEGWGACEDWGCWSIAPRAVLLLAPAESSDVDYQLDVTLRAFVGLAHPQLTCSVCVSNQELATWTFVHGRDVDDVNRSVTIPRHLVREGQPVQVEFRMPHLQSPAELGLRPDRRKLGIGMRRFCLRTADEADTPLAVNCRTDAPFLVANNPAAREWLTEGWGLIEAWGCWTVSPLARLALVAVQTPECDLELTLRMRAHIGQFQPELPLIISAGSKELARWQLNHLQDRGDHERKLVIPVAAWQGRRWLELQIELPGVLSPLELGLRDDARKLGLGLISLHVAPCVVTRPRSLFARLLNR